MRTREAALRAAAGRTACATPTAAASAGLMGRTCDTLVLADHCCPAGCSAHGVCSLHLRRLRLPRWHGAADVPFAVGTRRRSQRRSPPARGAAAGAECRSRTGQLVSVARWAAAGRVSRRQPLPVHPGLRTACERSSRAPRTATGTASRNGECVCAPGWEGPGCALRAVTCVGGCSGHGSCISAGGGHHWHVLRAAGWYGSGANAMDNGGLAAWTTDGHAPRPGPRGVRATTATRGGMRDRVAWIKWTPRLA